MPRNGGLRSRPRERQFSSVCVLFPRVGETRSTALEMGEKGTERERGVGTEVCVIEISKIDRWWRLRCNRCSILDITLKGFNWDFSLFFFVCLFGFEFANGLGIMRGGKKRGKGSEKIELSLKFWTNTLSEIFRVSFKKKGRGGIWLIILLEERGGVSYNSSNF